MALYTRGEREEIQVDPERVSVAKNYNHPAWSHAKQRKLDVLLREKGQTTLDTFVDTEILVSQATKQDNCIVSSKSTQTRFTNGGDNLNMETVDNLDPEVQELPQSDTLEAEVVEIHKGERQEFFDPNEDGEYEFGEADDVLLRLQLEYDYEGTTLDATVTIAYYDNPHAQSDLGAFKRRYGSLETGKEVMLDFDEDSNYSLVLPN